VPVSYSGGVFQSQGLVLAPFRAALARRLPAAALIPPRFSPTIGAALQAARLAGQPLDDAALAQLEGQ